MSRSDYRCARSHPRIPDAGTQIAPFHSLHTETYPYAAFTGRIVRTKPSDEGTKVDVRGTMDIHGVKHPMQVSGTISGSGDKIRVRSLFKVKLTDHDIEIPSFMFLKIDEVMELVLDYHLRNVNKQE